MACYLLRAGDTLKYKIGYAGNVSDRVRSLQAAHWETLHVIRIWAGGTNVEAWLHREFGPKRIARDWFDYDERMLTIEPPSFDHEGANRGRKRAASSKSIALWNIADKFGGQSQLGRAIGVGQGTVSHWFETGTIPYPRIMQIINAGKQRNSPIDLQPNDFFVVTQQTTTGEVA